RGARLAFLRTDKGGMGTRASPMPGRRKRPALIEGLTGIALAAGATALFVTNITEMVVIDVFAATLVVQSVPFLCAPLLYALEMLARRQAPARRRLAAARKPAPVPAALPEQRKAA